MSPLSDQTQHITVQATDAEGRTGRKEVTLSSSLTAGFICRPDKAVYDGGTTVKLTALGTGIGKSVLAEA